MDGVDLGEVNGDGRLRWREGPEREERCGGVDGDYWMMN